MIELMSKLWEIPSTSMAIKEQHHHYENGTLSYHGHGALKCRLCGMKSANWSVLEQHLPLHLHYCTVLRISTCKAWKALLLLPAIEDGESPSIQFAAGMEAESLSGCGGASSAAGRRDGALRTWKGGVQASASTAGVSPWLIPTTGNGSDGS